MSDSDAISWQWRSGQDIGFDVLRSLCSVVGSYCTFENCSRMNNVKSFKDVWSENGNVVRWPIYLGKYQYAWNSRTIHYKFHPADCPCQVFWFNFELGVSFSKLNSKAPFYIYTIQDIEMYRMSRNVDMRMWKQITTFENCKHRCKRGYKNNCGCGCGCLMVISLRMQIFLY